METINNLKTFEDNIKNHIKEENPSDEFLKNILKILVKSGTDELLIIKDDLDKPSEIKNVMEPIAGVTIKYFDYIEKMIIDLERINHYYENPSNVNFME